MISLTKGESLGIAQKGVWQKKKTQRTLNTQRSQKVMNNQLRIRD
jgi:hypothetical protein